MAHDWLNYHHLHYFWVTAREGSLTRAAARLRLAPSTLSTQIKTLEESLGSALFERRGRGLALTDRGTLVASYADQIFGLGQDLRDAVRHRSPADVVPPVRMRVGTVSILPKLVVVRLLAPALALPGLDVHLSCTEDQPQALLTELSLHHLDLVLVDSPVATARAVGARSHLLGDSGVTVCGTRDLAERYRDGFPRSLDGAPFLLPAQGSTVRQLLETWFIKHDVMPKVVAELSDSALMKAFGHQGAGLFVVPELISADVAETYGVVALGTLPDAREHYYAITPDRPHEHPAVSAVLTAARAQLGQVSG